MTPSDPSRRDFLRTTTAVGLGAALSPAGRLAAETPHQATALFAAPPMERVRIGFVGVGGQGSVHVDNLLKIEGVEIRAICDIVEWKVARAQDAVVAADQPKPAGYARGPRDFERMCAEQDLDLVFTATPWEWHVPVMLAALQHGKHAAVVVGGLVDAEFHEDMLHVRLDRLRAEEELGADRLVGAALGH